MQPIKLLLVDDEIEFRQATVQALTRRGFAVSEADGGERALELLAQDCPDVVVLDLRMEGIDGIETLRRLRQDHRTLPVIILTGHGGYQDALSGIQLDIVDFLQKPVEVEQLAALVRERLAQGRQRTLAERTIGELMVPAASYQKVYLDQPVREVIQLLKGALFQQVKGRLTEQGHRTVLVYSRLERFVGVLRLNEVLALALPPFLRQNPYASFFTGMFLAQCKVIGSQPVGEILAEQVTIALEAPLMEAVHLLVSQRLINLPVLAGGQLVGVLRDKDLLLEIAGCI